MNIDQLIEDTKTSADFILGLSVADLNEIRSDAYKRVDNADSNRESILAKQWKRVVIAAHDIAVVGSDEQRAKTFDLAYRGFLANYKSHRDFHFSANS
jgi:hypothetical protein